MSSQLRSEYTELQTNVLETLLMKVVPHLVSKLNGDGVDVSEEKLNEYLNSYGENDADGDVKTSKKVTAKKTKKVVKNDDEDIDIEDKPDKKDKPNKTKKPTKAVAKTPAKKDVSKKCKGLKEDETVCGKPANYTVDDEPRCKLHQTAKAPKKVAAKGTKAGATKKAPEKGSKNILQKISERKVELNIVEDGKYFVNPETKIAFSHNDDGDGYVAVGVLGKDKKLKKLSTENVKFLEGHSIEVSPNALDGKPDVKPAKTTKSEPAKKKKKEPEPEPVEEEAEPPVDEEETEEVEEPQEVEVEDAEEEAEDGETEEAEPQEDDE
jgi:hypothetical protein